MQIDCGPVEPQGPRTPDATKKEIAKNGTSPAPCFSAAAMMRAYFFRPCEAGFPVGSRWERSSLRTGLSPQNPRFAQRLNSPPKIRSVKLRTEGGMPSIEQVRSAGVMVLSSPAVQTGEPVPRLPDAARITLAALTPVQEASPSRPRR